MSLRDDSILFLHRDLSQDELLGGVIGMDVSPGLGFLDVAAPEFHQR